MKVMYAGSFDPFTNGHLYMVKELCDIFETVVVCIAKNNKKERQIDVEKMKALIEQTLQRENLTNAVVVIHNGLIADYCKENNISYLARGLRNTTDYLYEENIAKINYEINSDLKTIYLRAQDDAISSSMVKELYSYRKNISKYVPEEISNYLKEQRRLISIPLKKQIK